MKKRGSMLIGEFVKVKFSPFKNRFAFECSGHGITLEKTRGGICMYATDGDHEEVYCAIPLGLERDFKDSSYYVYAPNDHQMLLRVNKAVMLVDFQEQCCSTNVKDFRVYGSKLWGQNCLVPWNNQYTEIYNAAEKARVEDY